MDGQTDRQTDRQTRRIMHPIVMVTYQRTLQIITHWQINYLTPRLRSKFGQHAFLYAGPGALCYSQKKNPQS